MKSELQEQLLGECTKIAEELLFEAEEDSSGLSWVTLVMDEDNRIHKRTSEDIYSGVSGISLFFIELYKKTREERYLTTAMKSMRWVKAYCHHTPPQRLGFLTGRLGVCYSLLKLYEVVGESSLLQSALEIASRELISERRMSVADFIGGSSGVILVLLHLHAATKQEWLLKVIDNLVRHLIEAANINPGGIFWDRSPNTIRGLCGFAHGASGVGSSLLELGYYFKNPSFFWLAEESFEYEASCFDSSILNWPDYRKGVFTKEDSLQHKQEYLNGNASFFKSPRDMNAWCHGAAGIGLTRLRAYELLRKPKYLRESETAIDKTWLTDVKDSHEGNGCFVLCHGGGGNAELFLEAFRLLRDEKYLAHAEVVAEAAISTKITRSSYGSGFVQAGMPRDLSLFMGDAGVGYFFLRVLDPLSVPSVLFPSMRCTIGKDDSTNGHDQINIQMSEIYQTLLSRYFRRTIWVADRVINRDLRTYFEHDHIKSRNLIEEFPQYLHSGLCKVPRATGRRLVDVLELESKKMKMDHSISSYALLRTRYQLAEDMYNEYISATNEDFMGLALQLVQGVSISKTKWNWAEGSPEVWVNNIKAKGDRQAVLLVSKAEGVSEVNLTLLAYATLIQFEHTTLVRDAVTAVISSVVDLRRISLDLARVRVAEQIREALKGGILEIPSYGRAV